MRISANGKKFWVDFYSSSQMSPFQNFEVAQFSVEACRALLKGRKQQEMKITEIVIWGMITVWIIKEPGADFMREKLGEKIVHWGISNTLIKIFPLAFLLKDSFNLS